MNFLIQKIDGEIKHDFSFHLLKSLEYLKWLDEKPKVYFDKYSSSHFNKNPSKLIPIGSVEFVQGYLKEYFELFTRPINIPESLNVQDFLGRKIKFGDKYDIIEASFIKSNTKVKGQSQLIELKEVDLLINDEFLISEIIDIKSEWRGFVHNHQLLDIRNYSGDPFTFPNIEKVREMITSYTDQPIAYTIDVAVLEDSLQTVLIEIHDFYSCGLYGFQDYRKLPIMFSQWYYEFLRKHKV